MSGVAKSDLKRRIAEKEMMTSGQDIRPQALESDVHSTVMVRAREVGLLHTIDDGNNRGGGVAVQIKT